MMRKIFLLAALLMAALNLRPAISSISPLMASIRESLGVSGTVASLLTAIPVLCMGIFALIAVRLSNKWGNERVIAASLLLIGVATVARGFVFSSGQLLLTAFLAGIGVAIIGPLLSGFIKANFEKPASVMGVYSGFLVVGAAMGAWFVVPLQEAFDSWKIAAAVWGVPAFVAFLLWMKPVQAKGSASMTRASEDRSSHAPNRWLFNGRAWLLTLFFGIMAMVFYSMTTWMAPLVKEMGYSEQVAASALTLFTLVQIPISLLLPALIARFPARIAWLVAFSSIELLGLLLMHVQASPWLFAPIIGIGAGGLFPIALLLPLHETEHPHEVNKLSAMNQSGGYMIASLGPLLVGWTHDMTSSYLSALIGLEVLVVLMIFIQLQLGKKPNPVPVAKLQVENLQESGKGGRNPRFTG